MMISLQKYRYQNMGSLPKREEFSVKNLERMSTFYQFYEKSATLLSKSEREKTQIPTAKLGNTKDQDIHKPTILQQLNLVKKIDFYVIISPFLKLLNN